MNDFLFYDKELFSEKPSSKAIIIQHVDKQ